MSQNDKKKTMKNIQYYINIYYYYYYYYKIKYLAFLSNVVIELLLNLIIIILKNYDIYNTVFVWNPW